MNREQQKAMFTKGSLPSKKISRSNGRPDDYLRYKEPKKIKIRKGNFDGTHFKTSEGHLSTLSPKATGIFQSKGFKHPVDIPDTPRGFDLSTDKFTIWTDQYGNVFNTRQGTPTYNGGDADDAEHKGLGSSVTHEGKTFIDQGRGRQDRESRSPLADKNKKYYEEDYLEQKLKKEHDDLIKKWNSGSRQCSACGGSGHGFNFDDAVKAPTGRVGIRTGMGKCARCGGSGRA